ncbi:hypothetical protein C1H46_004309 [Malus baccata]|uniref:Uncharacterized protein n=1 Tax=Malus baccata TaxID=106549 RepID=A0A540NG76_MALBA|nr:hypothetical protein C1H46_004309 [Malus baccata]
MGWKNLNLSVVPRCTGINFPSIFNALKTEPKQSNLYGKRGKQSLGKKNSAFENADLQKFST